MTSNIETLVEVCAELRQANLTINELNQKNAYFRGCLTTCRKKLKTLNLTEFTLLGQLRQVTQERDFLLKQLSDNPELREALSTVSALKAAIIAMQSEIQKLKGVAK